MDKYIRGIRVNAGDGKRQVTPASSEYRAVEPARICQVQFCIDADGSGECDGTEFLWEYDAYGNLLNDNVTRYTYDAAGRLSSTLIRDGSPNTEVTTYYHYNGDGERVSQSTETFDVILSLLVKTSTTAYVLDVAASTVLSETTTVTADPHHQPSGSTAHYLNGLSLIAQQVVTPEDTASSARMRKNRLCFKFRESRSTKG